MATNEAIGVMRRNIAPALFGDVTGPGGQAAGRGVMALGRMKVDGQCGRVERASAFRQKPPQRCRVSLSQIWPVLIFLVELTAGAGDLGELGHGERDIAGHGYDIGQFAGEVTSAHLVDVGRVVDGPATARAGRFAHVPPSPSVS